MTTNKVARELPPFASRVRSVVWALRRQRLKAACPGRVRVPNDFSIGAKGVVVSPTLFECGSKVAIGREFHCEADVTMGEDVVISSRVSIVGNDHDLTPGAATFYSSTRLSPAKVVFEGRNFVGHGTILVGNITVGYGSVIGAGSVVVESVPAGVVAAGVPCRVLRAHSDESSTS